MVTSPRETTPKRLCPVGLVNRRMGIRGLTASLRPFAARSELAGRIVIDGPALAYHILFACRLESRVSTVLKDPSYSALGSKAIQWLDDLQSHGCQVY